MSHSLVVILAFAALADAYTTFESTCTLPSTVVNFVSGSDTRGTMDILWSCLFTIIACTYTVLHLNVPEQRLGRDPGRIGDIKWMLKRTGHGLKWMLITIIAPEYPLGKYWGDLWTAKKNLAKLQKLADEDEVPWTLTHSSFADMGGFIIKWDFENEDRVLVGDSDVPHFKKPIRLERARSLPDLRSQHPNTAIGSTFTQCGTPIKLEDQEIDAQSLVKTEGAVSDYPFMHLLGADIIELREAGVISRLPCITEEELKDKSKGDIFVRLIAICQIAWMVIQIIVRAVRGLAVSQLEIAVVAFATCAIFMYALNWNKPKGVQVPYKLSQPRKRVPRPIVDSIIDQRKARGGYLGNSADFFYSIICFFKLNDVDIELRSRVIPDSFCQDDESSWRDSTWGGIVGLTLFGVLHICAWNFEFPTKVEMVLWRVASVWCAGYSVIYFTLILVLIFLDSDLGFVNGFSLAVLLLSYVLAGVFLLMEIFRSLCFLPPTAYVGTWGFIRTSYFVRLYSIQQYLISCINSSSGKLEK